MFWLALPAIEQHEWTQRAIESMRVTVAKGFESFHLVLFDQASQEPYNLNQFSKVPFNMTLIRNPTNIGYYHLMKEIASFATAGDIIGLAHNDVVYYEYGWNEKVIQAYVERADMGMLGFCGSWQVDPNGGRGSGTMINFRGLLQQHAQTHTWDGKRHRVLPAVVYDSLFMTMRQPLVPVLRITADDQIGHFLDRVWPLRMWEAGYKCGFIGVEIDHAGGVTTVDPKTNAIWERDSKAWCLSQHIPDDRQYNFNRSTTARQVLAEGGYQSLMYVEAEDRFLKEFIPKGMVPSWVDGSWQYHRGVPAGHFYQ